MPISTTAYTVTENVPAGMQVYSATASNTPKVMSYREYAHQLARLEERFPLVTLAFPIAEVDLERVL